MTSENKNKENIISENHPEESKNFGEERIKDKKNSDEGKPIHNYPYEFYEENKNKIELKQNDSQTKEENKSDKKEIIKEEEPKIQNMKENVENKKLSEIKIYDIKTKEELEKCMQNNCLFLVNDKFTYNFSNKYNSIIFFAYRNIIELKIGNEYIKINAENVIKIFKPESQNHMSNSSNYSYNLKILRWKVQAISE